MSQVKKRNLDSNFIKQMCICVCVYTHIFLKVWSNVYQNISGYPTTADGF